MKDEALGALRHVLTTGGGILATKGVIDSSEVESLAGAIVIIVGFALSFLDKRGQKKKVEAVKKAAQELIENVEKVIVGKRDAITLVLVALLCEGDQRVMGMARDMGRPSSAVSQQLRILRMSGLVQTERINGYSVYRLSEDHLRDLIRCMHGCCAVS